jgi:hypothetical protein
MIPQQHHNHVPSKVRGNCHSSRIVAVQLAANAERKRAETIHLRLRRHLLSLVGAAAEIAHNGFTF